MTKARARGDNYRRVVHRTSMGSRSAALSFSAYRPAPSLLVVTRGEARFLEADKAAIKPRRASYAAVRIALLVKWTGPVHFADRC